MSKILALLSDLLVRVDQSVLEFDANCLEGVVLVQLLLLLDSQKLCLHQRSYFRQQLQSLYRMIVRVKSLNIVIAVLLNQQRKSMTKLFVPVPFQK